MANLSDGDYYIVNGADASLYLDVVNGDRRNGANVRVFVKTQTDAQVFSVRTRSGGTRQILSRFTGKSIDCEQAATGKNVQMYTDSASRYQRWVVTDTGNTMAVEGETLPLYKLHLVDPEGGEYPLVMELAGTSGFEAGTNVVLSNDEGTSADQTWAFLPVPAIESGGVYELLLNLNKSFAADIASWSKANNARLILAGNHHGNNQKFYLHRRSGDQWTLRNINSGRYIQMHNGALDSSGTQIVTQWADSEPTQLRWQWRPESFGTVTMGGVERTVIKLWSWFDGTGTNYLLDANQHEGLDLGQIRVCGVDPDGVGQYSQEWVLIPTYATDPTMPIPSQIGWATSVGSPYIKRMRQAATTLYPAWYCPRSWTSNGPNHYEWRYARKYQTHLGGWVREYPIEQAGWETASVTIRDGMCWVTEGLPADYDETKYKAVAYDVQVRCVGAGETACVVGHEASETLTAIKEPNITISNAGFSPEGLRFDYTSDYEGGTTDINVRGIYRNGVDLTPYTWYQDFQGLDQSGSIMVDVSKLKEWLREGDEIVVRWTGGTDVLPEFDTVHETPLTVAYDTGHGAELVPSVTNGEGRTLRIELDPHYATERVWYRSESDGLMELERDDDGAFYVDYPFGEDVEIWVSGRSRDGDTWGVWNETYDSSIGGKAPCHAWNWEGGSFLLELRQDEPLETDLTVESDTETVKLKDRQWDSVLVGGTSSAKLRAEGEFGSRHFPELEATRQGLEALRKQAHVRYRSPHGLRCDVCVTGYSLTCQRGVWHVSIDMVREDT